MDCWWSDVWADERDGRLRPTCYRDHGMLGDVSCPCSPFLSPAERERAFWSPPEEEHRHYIALYDYDERFREASEEAEGIWLERQRRLARRDSSPYVPSDRISARLRLNRSNPNRCVARNSFDFLSRLVLPQAPPRGVRPARRAVAVGVECEAVRVSSPLILAWESAVPGSSRAPARSFHRS
jgi:hypothetical protein